MNKIKFIGALIIVLLIILALLSKYISMQNSANLNLLKIINEQKAFTQEISKNIFYIYKNKNASTTQLDESIKLFVNNMNNRDDILHQIHANEINKEIDQIILLWNDFYLLVENFRDKNKINSPYTNIILEEIVNNIYKKNLKLVVEFNKLIVLHKHYTNTVTERNRFIQITLFTMLFILLLYLFTQLKELMLFIQKFLQTSKKIIHTSTIKGLKPIDVHSTLDTISEASDDFNFLIHKIDKSIDTAAQSMQNTTLLLEQIENNIEDLLELIITMENEQSLDKELIKKEDSIIEALDELSAFSQKLQSLKKNLENFKK
jgi:methyl-accepting chemotaxis protein